MVGGCATLPAMGRLVQLAAVVALGSAAPAEPSCASGQSCSAPPAVQGPTLLQHHSAGVQRAAAAELAATPTVDLGDEQRLKYARKTQVAMELREMGSREGSKKRAAHKPLKGNLKELPPIQTKSSDHGIIYVEMDRHRLREHHLQKALQNRHKLSRKTQDVLDRVVHDIAQREEEEHRHDAVNPNATGFQRDYLNHTGMRDAEHDLASGNNSALFEDHLAIMRALEEESQMVSPEDAAQNGSVITSAMEAELFGNPDTAEGVSSTSPFAKRAVQGDMIGNNETQTLLLLQAVKTGARWAGNPWEDKGDIKYCFGNGIQPTSKRAFQDAVQHFRNMIPCMNFREVAVGSDSDKKCAEQPAIYVFSSEGGCFANVGSPWQHNDGSYGDSVCHLQADGCDTMGIAVHELGHNLGMTHEQSRTDHESHVRILRDNIEPAKAYNYDIEEGADKSLPYDIMSVMHYGDSDFGKRDAAGNKMKTMEAVGASVSIMGNGMGLTLQDARQVGKMYGCLDEIDDFKVCTNDPGKCTKDECVCHQDPAESTPVMKAQDGDCFRCLKQCPDSPYGSPSACACPEGRAKSSFSSNGETFTGCEVNHYFNCADSEGDAQDSYRDKCSAYATNPGWCEKYDDEDFKSADMCCACGGGTSSPTPAPAEATTRAPTPAPTQAPTQAPTAAPTTAPTQAPTGGECQDLSTATDSYGDACSTYFGSEGWCGRFDDDDFASNAMCCACGGTGAESPPPTEAPTHPPARTSTCTGDTEDEFFCDWFNEPVTVTVNGVDYQRQRWCGPQKVLNGMPSLTACPIMCGMCEDPPPCWDQCTSACQLYATTTSYCSNPAVNLGGVPFPQACPFSCHACTFPEAAAAAATAP